MDKVIDPGFRRQLLARPAVMIMMEWIRALYKKNQQYESLLSENILTKEEWSSLKLPILFTPGRLSFIYLQLQKIQDYLVTNPNCTYDELFIYIYPRLGRYYQTFRETYKNRSDSILAAFCAMKNDHCFEKIASFRRDDNLEILRTSALTTGRREDFQEKETKLSSKQLKNSYR